MRQRSAAQADDLYELVSEPQGRSLIVTSNRAPSDWYPLFLNPVVAESLLDRLINTSHQFSGRRTGADGADSAPGALRLPASGIRPQKGSARPNTAAYQRSPEVHSCGDATGLGLWTRGLTAGSRHLRDVKR
jgi:hypothetical protein